MITNKIIKIYINNFEFIYINRNYFNLVIFNNFELKKIIRDIKKLRDENISRECLFITRDILLKLLTTFNTFIFENAILHVFFCLVFANFFRINKFIYNIKNLSNFIFD